MRYKLFVLLQLYVYSGYLWSAALDTFGHYSDGSVFVLFILAVNGKIEVTPPFMPLENDEFYRIQKLPPYVFAVVNEMKARLRASQQDVVDFGMGNPDGATPRVIVQKMAEAARNAKNHR